jgi:hypothetical protein
MASNISVVLTLDNKQYITNLNKAEQETKDFATTAETSTAKANDGFKKLNDTTGVLTTGMNKLKAAIAGVAFLGFARGAVQMADGIVDLSESTGIAIDKIIGFQNAVKAAGGNSEGAAKGIQTLYLKIAEAINGSAEAQISLAEVGVTLNDLRKLSEEEILAKTIDGLAKLGTGAEKTALQSELMGKAMRGVTIDPRFVETLAQGSEESKRLADRIRQAAELNDQWEASITRIRFAFIEAFGPAFNLIAKMLEQIPALTTVFKVLGAVIVAVFAASGLRAFISLLGMAGRGVAAIADGFNKIRSMGGLGKAITGPATNKGIASVRDAASAAGLVGGGVAGAGLLFGSGPSAEEKKAQAEKEAAQKQEEQTTKTVTSAYDGKARAIRATVDAYKNSIDSISEAIDMETQLIGKGREDVAFIKTMNDIRKREGDEINRLTQAKAAMSEVDKKLGLGKVYDQQIAAVKQLARAEEEQAQQSLKLNETKRRENTLTVFGIQQEVAVNKQLSDVQAQIANVNLPDLERRYAAIDKAGRDAANAQIAAEEAARQGKLTDAERAGYYEAASVGAQKLKQATQELLSVELQRDAVNFGLRQYIANQERVQDVVDNLKGQTLVGLEKVYYDIEIAANKAARAQINAQSIKLGRDLSPEEQQRYYDAAKRGLEDVKVASGEAYEASRKFENGWTKSWRSYIDEASNAAKISERLFSKATQGMEDAIVNFARTGKFEWKGFVGSIAEELLRSNVKKLIAQAFGAVGSGGGGGGGFLSNLFAGFFANGGVIPPGQFGVVGERGPELISGPATVTPMTSGGTQYVTYNINAVDAPSFKQLIASDPSFIHAIAQKGGRSIATRR